MDDAQPVELGQESLSDYDDPAVITVTIDFKSGSKRRLKFNAPVWTPVYAEPVTGTSIHQIVASAFSVGEVPFLALPSEIGGTMYFDLSSVNSVDVEVEYVGTHES
jgi:hypothetical protein